MKYLYRISMSDGQEHIKHYDEVDIKELQEYLQHIRWISINDNLSISTHHIVSIECIATVNKYCAPRLLREDEYTIKQLNKYLKGILK